MALSSTTCRVKYTGDGTDDTFDYTFRIQAAADLLVLATDGETIETLALITDYTVTGVGDANGGTVVLVDDNQDWLDADGDLDTGWDLIILRRPAVTQPTDIRNQGDFYPETHEDAFDRQVMIDQGQQDQINRSLKLPENLTSAEFDPTLPVDLLDSPGAYLVINADGDGLEVSGSTLNVTGAGAVISDADGNLSSEAQLDRTRGGTGISSTATFPASGVVVTRDATETLANKTLTTPNIATIINVGTLSLPNTTCSLLGNDTTQTITNKTISGASNTISNINLATQVTGNLPVTNLNSGTSASATTFWRGDGTWGTPAGAGDVVGPASAVDSEVVLFSGTTGKLIKRATGTGIARLTSGVISAVSDIADADISAGAAISRSKIATDTANRVVHNSGAGGLTSTASFTFDGTTLALGSASQNLSVGGVTTLGGVTAASGVATVNADGTTIIRNDSAGNGNHLTIQNRGITAANQGARILFQLQNGGSAGQDAGYIGVKSLGDWNSGAARDSSLVFATTNDASITAQMELNNNGELLLGGASAGGGASDVGSVKTAGRCSFRGLTVGDDGSATGNRIEHASAIQIRPSGSGGSFTFQTNKSLLLPDAGAITHGLSASTMAFYQSGSKFVIGYNEAGTSRYKYLDMAGTGVTWVHSTTAV